MAPPITCSCGECQKCKRREYMRAYYHRPRRGTYTSGGSVALTCERCGVSFETTRRRVRGHGQRFCSRHCKSEARKATLRITREQAKPNRECAYCGATMAKAMRADAKFCSASCNERAHAQTRKFRRRLSGDAPLRPRKEPLVNLAAIGERDGWRCGICRKPVERSLRHPDPQAPSLDHVVPVSQGGGHEPENLRLTHLRCNVSRQDRGGAEQLLLV